MTETVKLTEKTARVLEILKGNGGEMFAEDVAVVDPALFEKGAKSVSPILNTLVKKELAIKAGKGSREVLDKDGNKVTREYTLYQVSEAGASLVYEVK